MTATIADSTTGGEPRDVRDDNERPPAASPDPSTEASSAPGAPQAAGDPPRVGGTTRKLLSTAAQSVVYMIMWGFVCSIPLRVLARPNVSTTTVEGQHDLAALLALAGAVVWVLLVIESTRRYYRTYGMTKEQKKALAKQHAVA